MSPFLIGSHASFLIVIIVAISSFYFVPKFRKQKSCTEFSSDQMIRAAFEITTFVPVACMFWNMILYFLSQIGFMKSYFNVVPLQLNDAITILGDTTLGFAVFLACVNLARGIWHLIND
jgi:heme/copper-type cytochrome/quinol oxidase subunit 2